MGRTDALSVRFETSVYGRCVSQPQNLGLAGTHVADYADVDSTSIPSPGRDRGFPFLSGREVEVAMSAFGTKRTYRSNSRMSALRSEAADNPSDGVRSAFDANVALGSVAD